MITIIEISQKHQFICAFKLYSMPEQADGTRRQDLENDIIKMACLPVPPVSNRQDRQTFNL